MSQVTRRQTVRDATAVRLGARLKRARLQARLTQQQVAGDRYTKAYVSALENGLVRPSVTALDYFAGRLGTTASELISDAESAWTRLEADLLLASGNWQSAADAYAALLDRAADRGSRAEILLGQAEALARLDRGREAAGAAAEAASIFESLGRHAEAALANYWLSAAMFYQDNVIEAKAILQSILARVRAGLQVEPDFKLRLLMALSSNEAREGNHQIALSYLEEIRGLADSLDDRRRAAYLFDLAHNYCETGDFEAAIRTGYASLALYSAAQTPLEMAKLENELALAHLGAGSAERAAELAASAHQHFTDLGDERLLAHVLDTQAQIALARGKWADALALAGKALELAETFGNDSAATGALLTSARSYAAMSRPDDARSMFERAAARARVLGSSAVLRSILTDWAELLAATGDHTAAYELTREALAAQH